jgi:hypothetical protein
LLANERPGGHEHERQHDERRRESHPHLKT